MASTRTRAHTAPSLHGAPAGHRRPGFVVGARIPGGRAGLAGLAGLAACLALAAVAGLAPPAQAAGQKGEFGLGVILGGGTYRNHNFNNSLAAHGYGAIDSGVEYGFSADYRLSRWFSVGFEVMRVGGDAAAPVNPPAGTLGQYSAEAAPVAVDLIAHLARQPHGNLDAFVGMGPLLGATIRAVQDPFELEARRTGFYAHAGAGFEVRFSPMVALGARGLVRHATAHDIDLRAVSGDPTAIWDLDFSGVAFSIGPRIYFGNVE